MNLTYDISVLSELSALNIISVEPPVLGYNTLKKQLVYSFIGRNNLNREILIEMRIKNTDLYRLDDVNVYIPRGTISSILTGFVGVTASIGTSFSSPFTLFYNAPTITLSQPPSVSLPSPINYFPQISENTIFVMNVPAATQLNSSNLITTMLGAPANI